PNFFSNTSAPSNSVINRSSVSGTSRRLGVRICIASSAQGGKKLREFRVHVIGALDGLGDLLADDFAVALAQPMDGDLHRAFAGKCFIAASSHEPKRPRSGTTPASQSFSTSRAKNSCVRSCASCGLFPVRRTNA